MARQLTPDESRRFYTTVYPHVVERRNAGVAWTVIYKELRPVLRAELRKLGLKGVRMPTRAALMNGTKRVSQRGGDPSLTFFGTGTGWRLTAKAVEEPPESATAEEERQAPGPKGSEGRLPMLCCLLTMEFHQLKTLHRLLEDEDITLQGAERLLGTCLAMQAATLKNLQECLGAPGAGEALTPTEEV